jgi:hypothetical protein
MVKLLCVDARGNYPCICDMFAIHHFFSKRIVDRNGIYLTCADIQREAITYGPPSALIEVFNPLYDSPFWFKTSVDNIYNLAKRELEQLVNQTPAPTPNDRIIVIILAHGNSLGQIAFGDRDVYPEEFLNPLESYPDTRITIISNACYSATPQWQSSILSLRNIGDDHSSSAFGHCAATTLSYNHRRTPSDRRHGSIFITHVLKTTKPDATIKVHTVETKRLVLGDSLAVHGKAQITASYQNRCSTEDKRTDFFFPEVSMASLIDDEYPMPIEARQGMFGWTIDSSLALLMIGLTSKWKSLRAAYRSSNWDDEALKPTRHTSESLSYAMGKARFMYRNDKNDPDPMVQLMYDLSAANATAQHQIQFLQALEFIEFQDISALQRVSQLSRHKRLRCTINNLKVTMRNGAQWSEFYDPRGTIHMGQN